MTTTWPNKDALSRAIDIFRDAMRPFLIRCLKRAPNATVEATIRRSLSPHQANNFDQGLGRSKDLSGAIDVNFFPALVQNNWREVFSTEFRDDRTIQNELWMIADVRNQVSHPGAQDFDAEYTRTHLYLVADALGRINALDEKKAVEAVRSQLLGPVVTVESTGDSSTAKPVLGANQPQKAEQPRSSSNLKPWREVIRPNQDARRQCSRT